MMTVSALQAAVILRECVSVCVYLHSGQVLHDSLVFLSLGVDDGSFPLNPGRLS